MSEENDFALIWPAPPEPSFSHFEMFTPPPPPQPVQTEGEFICPISGCIGPKFSYDIVHCLVICPTCKGGFPYENGRCREFVLRNNNKTKFKYCPNACCGTPTRVPKAAMEHPLLAHISMGTYCKGCGAMWMKKDYIDEPKPKPWIPPTPAEPPKPSAPVLEDTAHVKPDIYEHGVHPDNIGHYRELMSMHSMVRVLISIERLMKRQEGLLQTIVGQRLARIEDSLDEINTDMGAVRDVLENSVYADETAGGYEGCLRVYNENA